jgi:methyltransferase-like protein
MGLSPKSLPVKNIIPSGYYDYYLNEEFRRQTLCTRYYRTKCRIGF